MRGWALSIRPPATRQQQQQAAAAAAASLWRSEQYQTVPYATYNMPRNPHLSLMCFSELERTEKTCSCFLKRVQHRHQVEHFCQRAIGVARTNPRKLPQLPAVRRQLSTPPALFEIMGCILLRARIGASCQVLLDLVQKSRSSSV